MHVILCSKEDRFLIRSIILFKFLTLTYIHVFDECNQNWLAVASILENTLKTLKTSFPTLKEAFL